MSRNWAWISMFLW